MFKICLKSYDVIMIASRFQNDVNTELEWIHELKNDVNTALKWFEHDSK